MADIHAPHWEWRISKYDLRLRDAAGAYRGDEWTFAAQVGTVVSGHRLELAEYLAMENKYVAVAVRFVAESGLTSLWVENLQNRFTKKALKQAKHGLAHPFEDGVHIQDGGLLTGEAIERACRLNLREFLYCDLCEPNRFSLRFGWDYYLHIVSMSSCPESIRYAHDVGLFVEDIHVPSPGD